MILIQQPPIQQQLPENEVQPIVSKEQAAFPNEDDATLTDSSFLVIGSRDKTIKLWNLTLKTCVGTLYGHNDFVKCLQVYENSYGTQQFVASGSFDKTIKIWDISHKKLIATGTGHTQLIVSIKAFREKKQPRLASGSKDGTIKIWNCETYQLLHTIRLLPNDTIGQNSYCFLACLVSHNGYDNNNAEKRGCLFD